MRDLTGHKFGRLLVTRLSGIKKYKSSKNQQTKAYWYCLCECGTPKIIRGEHITSGRTVSCGCIYTEINVKHGNSRRGKKTQEYQSWLNMRGRIKSKEPHKMKSYGDVGIAQDWDSFINFLKDMGLKPTPEHELDRLDPFLPYCKENCRWATRNEQMQNQRRQYI